MRKVLVFGSFDGLHFGHLNFFKQAKEYGDYLIVVIARDATIKRIKNKSPLKNEKQRLKEIRKCKLVNEAVLGREDNPYLIIKKIKPDVICLGYDQKVFSDDLPEELKKMGLKTKIFRMDPYKPKKFHSSIIKFKDVK